MITFALFLLIFAPLQERLEIIFESHEVQIVTSVPEFGCAINAEKETMVCGKERRSFDNPNEGPLLRDTLEAIENAIIDLGFDAWKVVMYDDRVEVWENEEHPSSVLTPAGEMNKNDHITDLSFRFFSPLSRAFGSLWNYGKDSLAWWFAGKGKEAANVAALIEHGRLRYGGRV